MVSNDNSNSLNAESIDGHAKSADVVEMETKKEEVATSSSNENKNQNEQNSFIHKENEKRERSCSTNSIKPEKKKACRCRESCNVEKETKGENSSSNSNNKTADSMSTASTGVNENSSNSKGKYNKNEPFKFFIGGIPQFISNSTISDYFSKYGTVQNVMIAQDHRTKRNRGFAFVTMANQANKDKILKGPHELNGKRVDVREENNTTPSDIQRKIFVGGLNFFWTKDILADYFSTFGEIDLVQIVVDSSGRSRCFGFVVFTNEQSVAKVLKQKKHKIHDKIVEVRKAEPKKPKSNYKKHHHKCSSKCQTIQHVNQFPYNKESVAQWANFMYSTCGMPFLFNQRFQHNNAPEYFPQFNPAGNYYTGPLENMPPTDYNN